MPRDGLGIDGRPPSPNVDHTRRTPSSEPVPGSEPALKATQQQLAAIGYRPSDYAALVGTSAAVLSPTPHYPAAGAGEQDYEVAFWNVANFGPPVKKGETDGWVTRNEEQYAEKLEVIGRGIRLLNDGNGPDVLGLAEIGGQPVLEDLRSQHLDGLGYEIVHLRTQDSRGMDIAILSKLPLIGQPILHDVADANPTRGILEARFDTGGVELIALITHWPARGDGDYNLSRRTASAEALRSRIEQIQHDNPEAEVLVMGDFNELVNGSPMKVLGASADRKAVAEGKQEALLLHSAASMAARASGKPAYQIRSLEAVRREEQKSGEQFASYHFDGDEDWRTLDAVMGNRNLVDNKGLSLVQGSEAVVRHPLLLRTNGRPRGNSGSDHLMVRAVIRRHAPDAKN